MGKGGAFPLLDEDGLDIYCIEPNKEVTIDIFRIVIGQVIGDDLHS